MDHLQLVESAVVEWGSAQAFDDPGLGIAGKRTLIEENPGLDVSLHKGRIVDPFLPTEVVVPKVGSEVYQNQPLPFSKAQIQAELEQALYHFGPNHLEVGRILERRFDRMVTTVLDLESGQSDHWMAGDDERH